MGVIELGMLVNLLVAFVVAAAWATRPIMRGGS